MDARGTPWGRSGEVEELDAEAVEEWTDGSKMEGRAAGAARKAGIYRGTMASVADAEEAGSILALAWEEWGTVALDTQGVIQRIQNLTHKAPRLWIEEELV